MFRPLLLFLLPCLLPLVSPFESSWGPDSNATSRMFNAGKYPYLTDEVDMDCPLPEQQYYFTHDAYTQLSIEQALAIQENGYVLRDYAIPYYLDPLRAEGRQMNYSNFRVFDWLVRGPTAKSRKIVFDRYTMSKPTYDSVEYHVFIHVVQTISRASSGNFAMIHEYHREYRQMHASYDSARPKADFYQIVHCLRRVKEGIMIKSHVLLLQKHLTSRSEVKRYDVEPENSVIGDMLLYRRILVEENWKNWLEKLVKQVAQENNSTDTEGDLLSLDYTNITMNGTIYEDEQIRMASKLPTVNTTMGAAGNDTTVGSSNGAEPASVIHEGTPPPAEANENNNNNND